MLKEIQFRNFRVLRKAVLPLSRVTVLAGANGSGKSTVLEAITLLGGSKDDNEKGTRRSKYDQLISADQLTFGETVEVRYVWDKSGDKNSILLRWEKQKGGSRGSDSGITSDMSDFAARMKVFRLDSDEIAKPVQVVPKISLASTGRNLAGVLDNLKDASHERFEALNAELPKWLPEFDRIALEVASPGAKQFCLRRTQDRLLIRASDLSEGSLFALVLLTVAYLPDPPLLVGLEHPDAGIHPRLLRRVQDAIYRLAFPEDHGEKRPPTQVIATTHSPYFLDLFREHPEQVVFANKSDKGVDFQRLSDRPHINDILPDGPLGDLWYSGLLGGVPASS